MTDAELTDYLCLTQAEAAKLLPKLTPETRALYRRLPPMPKTNTLADWKLRSARRLRRMREMAEG
jgi:hypothetical protein